MIDPHHRCADCRQTADRDQYGFASSQRDRLVELCAIGGQVTQAMLSYGWFAKATDLCGQEDAFTYFPRGGERGIFRRRIPTVRGAGFIHDGRSTAAGLKAQLPC